MGRFIQIDPMTDEGGQESLSPYHFSYNNPIRYNDPDGKCPACIPIVLEGLKVLVTAAAIEGAKQLPAVQLDPAKLSGPLLMSSFGLGSAINSIVKSNTTSTESDKKNVPNPDGKKGDKAHQETIDKEEAKMKEEGYDQVDREIMVRTPDGEKSKRFIDLQGTNTQTGETKSVQVGKQNKNGTL